MSYLVRLASQRFLGSCRAIGVTRIGNSALTKTKVASSKRGISNIEDFLDIKVETKNGETYVEARPINTGREDKLINIDSDQACALCRLNIRNLDYTDVKILSQFVKRDGSLATYHESKLCSKQYYKVQRLIEKAQRCKLMPRPPDYFVPGAYHDLNTYLEPDRRRDQPMRVIQKQYWKV